MKEKELEHKQKKKTHRYTLGMYTCSLDSFFNLGEHGGFVGVCLFRDLSDRVVVVYPGSVECQLSSHRVMTSTPQRSPS